MAARPRESARRGAAIVLAAMVGILLTSLAYHPAVMSGDSLSLYEQALSGTLSGRKPPITPFLWMLILKVAPTPFALLLFQNLLFWGGLALLAAATRLNWLGAAAVVLVIGLFPPVFALLGTLWLDVILGSMLVLFVGLLVLGVSFESRSIIALSIIPLTCGLATRLNTLPAVLPLTVLLVAAWTVSGGSRGVSLRRLAVASVGIQVGMLAVVALLAATTRGGRPPASRTVIQFALLHDLAGMAVHSGDLRMPRYVLRAAPSISIEVIRMYYHAADVNRLFYNESWPSTALITSDEAEFRELLATWAHAIRAHPGAYLRRRVEVVKTIMQLDGVFYPFHTGIDVNQHGLTSSSGRFNAYVTRWLKTTTGVLFRGWIFLLLASVSLFLGVKRRNWCVVAVNASALCYVLPYAVVSNGSDFRFIWWLVVGTLAGSALWLVQPLEVAPRVDLERTA